LYAAPVPRDLWFSVLLVLVVATTLQHARAVRAAGLSPRGVRSRLHLSLNFASLIGSFALFPAVVIWHTWGFLFLAPAGFAMALRNMVYASKDSATHAESRREYLVSLASGGVLSVAGIAVLLS
jgi:hypothetical protein